MTTRRTLTDMLQRQLAWHEARKKELSKSGREHGKIAWDMLQHQAEIDDLTQLLAEIDDVEQELAQLESEPVSTGAITSILSAVRHFGSCKWAEGKGTASEDLKEVRAAWDSVYAEVQRLAAQSVPVQPESEPSEREALIAELRNASNEIANAGHAGWGNACTDAADMLEADAQESARLTASVRHWTRACVEFRNQRDAQQVAVPQTSNISAEMLAFLNGSGPLDGVWFGEDHPTERGKYWWRKHLSAVPQPAQEQEAAPQEPNNNEVICPNCCTQFRAIPVNVQRLMLDVGFEPPFMAAPQPAYVPLSDAEITRLWMRAESTLGGTVEAFTRLVEQAVRGKT